MPAFFVTGSGTDLGKTFVTAGLIRHLRAKGRRVDALKPIASGFDPADAGASDAGALLHALGRELTPENVAALSPWRFAAPLSPDMAATRENKVIDFEAVVAACVRAVDRSTDVLFIEGVGGVMTPISGTTTVLDLMARLRLPVILVAGSYLGTLSHTLTALEVMKRRGLQTLAIAVSETPGSSVPLEETAATLARFTREARVAPVPRGDSAHAIAALAGALAI